MKSIKEDFYILFFLFIKGIGVKTFQKIVDTKICLKTIYTQPEIIKKYFSEIFIDKIKSHIQSKEYNLYIEAICKSARDENIEFITIVCPQYPDSLKQISSPPAILFYIGDLSLLKQNSISIVGTRFPNSYGLKLTRTLIHELSKYDIITVSGLAYGIDTIVHEQTILHQKKTIAVLGSGLSKRVIYPKRNKNLASEIINTGGLLLSEYAPLTEAHSRFFPQRNRIISALSNNVIIAQARKKSGSLVTARHAIEQNKNVYIFPGSIFDPNQDGCNYLLKQGAEPIISIPDFCKHSYAQIEHNSSITKEKDVNLNEEQITILKCLSSKQPKSIISIQNETNYSQDIILETITFLESLNMVTQPFINHYKANP